VKPGAKTAEYIDDVVSKITLPGRDLPDGRRAAADLDHDVDERARSTFGGTSLLIVVGRGARYDSADEPASAAAEIRRLHEEGTRAVPGRQGAPGGF
jgi:hypothetical protein